MTTYFAFLRGINVGAHNRMTMDELEVLFEGLGYQNVETHIQSGNVLFETAQTDGATIASDVADAMDDEFGYDVPVMVRTQAELAGVVDQQPFDDPEADGIKRYITFLHEEPTEAQRGRLLAAGSDAESFEVRGRNVYSELDKEALGEGRFTDTGRKLGIEATRRNWDVVTAVLELGD